MNKHLYFDFDIPEYTYNKLDSLLDRVSVFLDIQPGDTLSVMNNKFCDALTNVDLGMPSKMMAVEAWYKATGQDRNRELIDYTETAMLIGALALMLGDIGK